MEIQQNGVISQEASNRHIWLSYILNTFQHTAILHVFPRSYSFVTFLNHAISLYLAEFSSLVCTVHSYKQTCCWHGCLATISSFYSAIGSIQLCNVTVMGVPGNNLIIGGTATRYWGAVGKKWHHFCCRQKVTSFLCPFSFFPALHSFYSLHPDQFLQSICYHLKCQICSWCMTLWYNHYDKINMLYYLLFQCTKLKSGFISLWHRYEHTYVYQNKISRCYASCTPNFSEEFHFGMCNQHYNHS